MKEKPKGNNKTYSKREPSNRIKKRADPYQTPYHTLALTNKHLPPPRILPN